MSDLLFLDFETRSTVDIKSAGADAYARHPSTEILCVGHSFDHEPARISPVNADPLGLFRHVEAGGTVVSHNAAFELAIWNYVGVRKYGWPELKPEQTVCTMAMAYALGLPGALERVAPALGVEAVKDMAGHRIMLQLSQPREVLPDGKVVWWEDAAKFEKLYAYCKQDVEVEREVYKRLLPLSTREREIWLLDQKINQRGVRVDREAVETAIKLVESEKARLDAEMRTVTKNAVATCTATGQLTDWLRWQGVKLEGVAKSDVIELLADPTLPESCRKALLLRQEAAKSSTAKLEKMRAGTCSDGRMRGIFQYHGASTGRWAGRRVQPQNFPRPKLSQAEIDEVFGILERGTGA